MESTELMYDIISVPPFDIKRLGELLIEMAQRLETNGEVIDFYKVYQEEGCNTSFYVYYKKKGAKDGEENRSE